MLADCARLRHWATPSQASRARRNVGHPAAAVAQTDIGGPQIRYVGQRTNARIRRYLQGDENVAAALAKGACAMANEYRIDEQGSRKADITAPACAKCGTAPACAKCGSAMKDVVTIAPVAGEPGLVAYECPACGHVTSVIVPPPSTG
jgi:hypothetical protein